MYEDIIAQLKIPRQGLKDSLMSVASIIRQLDERFPNLSPADKAMVFYELGNTNNHNNKIDKLQSLIGDGVCSPPEIWDIMSKINEIIDYLNDY